MSITTGCKSFRRLATLLLAAALLGAATAQPALADRYDDRYDRHRGYNDEYIFVATRSVTEMDVHPAAKVPLIPLALVLDVAVLPFEVIAGAF
jgi:hypothetical protein